VVPSEVAVIAEQLVVSRKPRLDDQPPQLYAATNFFAVRAAPSVDVINRKKAQVVFAAAYATVPVRLIDLQLQPPVDLLALSAPSRQEFSAIGLVLRPDPRAIPKIVIALVCTATFSSVGLRIVHGHHYMIRHFLVLNTQARSPSGGAPHGPQELYPHFARVGAEPPILWLIPEQMKPPRGFPWGGRRQVPLGAYTATTPPIRAASSCEIGFKYPARFGVRHVVIYLW